MSQVLAESNSLVQERIQLSKDGKQNRVEHSRKQEELRNLDSQAGRAERKLAQASRDTAEAWAWVKENQDKFQDHVFGPPIVECTVQDRRFVDSVESMLQKGDLCSFTVQSREDFLTLKHELQDKLRLADINIQQTSPQSFARYRPPIDDAALHELGFDSWALNLIQGPEPVLAMLCAQSRIHMTAISLRDFSEDQYLAVTRSPLTSWVSGRNSHQITRRREYGEGATSTRVRAVRAAQVWTDQAVDTGAKEPIQQEIMRLNEEARDLKEQIDAKASKIEQLKDRYTVLEREKVRCQCHLCTA